MYDKGHFLVLNTVCNLVKEALGTPEIIQISQAGALLLQLLNLQWASTMEIHISCEI